MQSDWQSIFLFLREWSVFFWRGKFPKVHLKRLIFVVPLLKREQIFKLTGENIFPLYTPPHTHTQLIVCIWYNLMYSLSNIIKDYNLSFFFQSTLPMTMLNTESLFLVTSHSRQSDQDPSVSLHHVTGLTNKHGTWYSGTASGSRYPSVKSAPMKKRFGGPIS